MRKPIHRRRAAWNDPVASCHFIEDETQGVNVRARVGALPFQLFRSHVGRRSHYDANRGRVPGMRGMFGQAEIQHFHAVFRDHDVGRF
jgi:hypothetical protein